MTWQSVVIVVAALASCVGLVFLGHAEQGATVLAFMAGLLAPTPKMLKAKGSPSVPPPA